MNKQVLDKLDDLIKSINEDERFILYKKIEQQLEGNKEIMILIDEVKQLQKQAVNFTFQGKKDEILEIDEKIKFLLSKLNDYPIYMEYTSLQEELNNDLQKIKRTLEDYLYKCTN